MATTAQVDVAAWVRRRPHAWHILDALLDDTRPALFDHPATRHGMPIDPDDRAARDTLEAMIRAGLVDTLPRTLGGGWIVTAAGLDCARRLGMLTGSVAS